ncbi:cysteine desulfurase, partial [Escherichia coli]
VSIAPALEPRVGGAALGVPPVNAPAPEGAAKASPYYFTDGSLQGWQATPQDIVVPSNGLASPEAFGLPG